MSSYTDMPIRRSRVIRDSWERNNRRASDSSANSDDTLVREPFTYDDETFDLSSYRHPYEIQPPPNAHTEPAKSAKVAKSVHWDLPIVDQKKYKDIDDAERGYIRHRSQRKRRAPSEEPGLFSSLAENDGDNNWDDLDDVELEVDDEREGAQFDDDLYEQAVEPDDPKVTGKKKVWMEDYEEVEDQALREMSYHQRRKELSKIKIVYHQSSVLNRELFLLKLGKALMTFGAPSHRIEAHLKSAAHVLLIEAEFIHIPGMIMCSILDKEEKKTETHFIRCGGRMALGRLHEVHQLYRAVVHDEMSAKKAGDRLSELLDSPPIRSGYEQVFLSFWLAALVCPLAFGGSFIDMWVAGAGAVFISGMRIGVIAKADKFYTHVFEYVVSTPFLRPSELVC